VGRIVFDAAALGAIFFSVLMVVNRNPVRGVLSLVVAFSSLAICYVLLLAPFVAVVQVIVYAGAILVLFLFVLMLLNIGAEERQVMSRPIQAVLGTLTIVVFGFLLFDVLRARGSDIPEAASIEPAALGDPARLARFLFSNYLLHFEAISVLLLAALVGAFVLARRELKG
jgi:NADH-quinone oxidoreductase subunit J